MKDSLCQSCCGGCNLRPQDASDRRIRTAFWAANALEEGLTHLLQSLTLLFYCLFIKRFNVRPSPLPAFVREELKLGLILHVGLQDGVGFGPFYASGDIFFEAVGDDERVDSGILVGRLDSYKQQLDSLLSLEGKVTWQRRQVLAFMRNFLQAPQTLPKNGRSIVRKISKSPDLLNHQNHLSRLNHQKLVKP